MNIGKEGVIFFDAGGTLIQPVRPVGEIYAEVARSFGVHADPVRLHEGFKRAWKALKPRDPVKGARVMDDRPWWFDVMLETWKGMERPENFEGYFDAVYDVFALPSSWQAYPEVAEVLEAIARLGLRCAVLSNFDRRLHVILAGFSWSRHFESVLVSSEIGAEKPHPLIFREAEKRLAISAEQAILWGDDPDCDGDGARAAGWQVEVLERPKIDLRDLLAKLTVSNTI